uniref:Lipocalin n=1 Tax=Rhipicephalus appendiculatus TaxID=34631 RepID=A0A131Z6X9_RHIAP
MEKITYVPLLFVAILKFAAAQNLYFHYLYDVPNVTKFMNTTLRIWTYNTTASWRAIFCKVDDVWNVTKRNVYFNRSQWSSGRWRTNSMNGTFDLYDPRVVYIGPTGGRVDSNETLEFVSRSFMCGVFRVDTVVPSGPTRWRELRFKYPNGTGRPEKECLNYFQTMRPRGRLLYGEMCDELL